MILSGEVVQQNIYYYIELELSGSTGSIDVIYDKSTDDDVVELVTKSVNYVSNGNRVSFGVNLLTKKPFLVRTDDDEKLFDRPAGQWDIKDKDNRDRTDDKFEPRSSDYIFEIEVGRNDGQWWVDPHEHFIVDAMNLTVETAEGEKIATVDNGYSYQLLLTPGAGTRVNVLGVPTRPFGSTTIFALDGLEHILDGGRLRGSAYGIWEES